MNALVTTVSGKLENVSKQQICRYMGMQGTAPSAELNSVIEELLPQFLSRVQCKACYLTVPVKCSGNMVDLSVFSVESSHLARNLQGCDHAVLFAATTGMAVEQQRRTAAITSPVKALVLDAMGTAAIEAYCDQLCTGFAQLFPAHKPRPRFGPGYGDLPLSVQARLLEVLDAQRKIGVAITEGMLMIPQKSVTAIMGLGKAGCMLGKSDCDGCGRTDCEFKL